MIRFMAVLLFVGVLSGPIAVHAETPLPAQDETEIKLDLANRFIAAIQTDQMSAMMSQMTLSLTPPREGQTAAENDALRQAMTETTDVMMTRLFDAMAPIYADIFTLEELTGLVAFYESDIGRSMMTKSYAATPRVTALVQAMMPEMVRDMAHSMCDQLSCNEAERASMNAALARSGFAAPPAD